MTGLDRHGEERGRERGGPTDLVGLHTVGEAGAEHVDVCGDDLTKRRPRVAGFERSAR